MARINLLPWREQLREERRQRFLVALGLVLLTAGGLVFLGDRYLSASIDAQRARNDFLRKEIAMLDARIKEIAELKTTLSNIYDNLDTLEPEIREANAKTSAKTNGAKVGMPANFFMVNPNLRGGASVQGNGGWTRYDARYSRFLGGG